MNKFILWLQMRVVLMVLLLVAIRPSFALEDYDRQQTQKRIEPVGHVNVSGQSTAPAAATVAQPEVKKLPGQATYEQYCITCHRDGVAGAPKFRDENDWKSRLATQSIDVLKATAIKGLNAMPPKGTCMECTDDEIKQAIEYMLPHHDG